MKDIVVKNGSYTNSAGEKKHYYVKIGIVKESEMGEYLLLFPHINLAGLVEAGKKNVLASMYEQRDRTPKPEPEVPTVDVDAQEEDDVPF